MPDQDSILPVDLTPYLNRWIALVRGRVVGVGMTAEQAQQAARRVRPKEKARVVFVDERGVVQESVIKLSKYPLERGHSNPANPGSGSLPRWRGGAGYAVEARADR
jgi:hypothetical protein